MLASVSTGFFPNSTSPPLSAVLTKFNNVDNISQFQSNFTISTKFQIFYQGFQENDNVENTDNTDKLLNTDILDNKDFSTIKTLIRVIPNFCYFFLHFFPLTSRGFLSMIPEGGRMIRVGTRRLHSTAERTGQGSFVPPAASLSTNQISSPVINTCLDFLFEAA